MPEVTDFLSSVFNSWVERVGFVLTILPFLENIPHVHRWLLDKPLLERFKPLLWIIGGVCIIYGFYDAWLTERHRAIEAERKFESLTHPKFEIQHGTTFTAGMVITNRDGTKQTYTIAMLPLTIINHGAPSMIYKAALKVKLSDGREGEGSFFLPPGESFSISDPRGNPIEISTSGSLFRKFGTPIPTGGATDGFVMFTFPADYVDCMTTSRAAGTVLTLEIQDVEKNPYYDRIEMTGIPSNDLKVGPSIRFNQP